MNEWENSALSYRCALLRRLASRSTFAASLLRCILGRRLKVGRDNRTTDEARCRNQMPLYRPEKEGGQ